MISITNLFLVKDPKTIAMILCFNLSRRIHSTGKHKHWQ